MVRTISNRLSFRSRLLLITLLPLIGIAALSWLVISVQTDRLIRIEVDALETRTLGAKQQEIRNYISLAQTSIRHLYEVEPGGRAAAQLEVQQILHDMTFGDDGYFFVYDDTGTNLVHPRLPHLIGRNWWDLQDPEGNFVIRELITIAQSGGGFYRYIWNKPTTGQPAPKIGYAEYLPKWGWMFGTGLYLDDVAREVAELELQTQSNVEETAVILFAITFFAVLLVALLLFAIRLSEERFADDRLKQLARRIVDVQEDERKRVSGELHDGISQLLVGARYALDSALKKARNLKTEQQKSDPGLEPLLGKTMDVLDGAISEVRRISKDLRPSILDDLGLAAAVQSLCNEFADQSGIDIQVNVEPVGNLLTNEAKTGTYRVIQEALNNAARHAECTDIKVQLSIADGSLKVLVEDNGKGFDSALSGQNNRNLRRPSDGNVQQGLGIRNMIERVESHGGKLDIKSTESHGTRIELEMPLIGSSPANHVQQLTDAAE